MQVIKRFEIELPSGPHVYTIVKSVWQKSMEVIEKLLAGEPQSTATAEPLLGLAVWHLYPDMAILGSQRSDVFQNDNLFVAGGILTLGMTFKQSVQEKGITWSLPLSHLRYYGKPITRTRSLGLGSERVHFDDLKYLIFGAMTGHWFLKCGGVRRVIDFFDALVSCWRLKSAKEVPREEKDIRRSIPPWLCLLWDTAREMRGSRGQAWEDKERLYKLGQRRGANFLSSLRVKAPEAFGLTSLDYFIKYFMDHEARISKVREGLSRLFQDEACLQRGFISYKPVQESKQRRACQNDVDFDRHHHPTHPDTSSYSGGDSSGEEFAIIVPHPESAKHQRRIPTNHLDVKPSIKHPWHVPSMISLQSSQVRRCTDLSAASGEQYALYLYRLGSPKDFDKGKLVNLQCPLQNHHLRSCKLLILTGPPNSQSGTKLGLRLRNL